MSPLAETTSWIFGESDSSAIAWVVVVDADGSAAELLWSEKDEEHADHTVDSMVRAGGDSLAISDNTGTALDGRIWQLKADGAIGWEIAIDIDERDLLSDLLATDDGIYWGGMAFQGNDLATRDATLGRLQYSGEPAWQLLAGYCGHDSVQALAQAPDGSMLVLQNVADHPNVSGVVRKFDPAGSEAWAERLPKLDAGFGTALTVWPSGASFVVGMAGEVDAHDYFVTRIAL